MTKHGGQLFRSVLFQVKHGPPCSPYPGRIKKIFDEFITAYISIAGIVRCILFYERLDPFLRFVQIRDIHSSGVQTFLLEQSDYFFHNRSPLGPEISIQGNDTGFFGLYMAVNDYIAEFSTYRFVADNDGICPFL